MLLSKVIYRRQLGTTSKRRGDQNWNNWNTTVRCFNLLDFFLRLSTHPYAAPGCPVLQVLSVLRTSLSLRRDVSLTTASRLYTGPEVGGCR